MYRDSRNVTGTSCAPKIGFVPQKLYYFQELSVTICAYGKEDASEEKSSTRLGSGGQASEFIAKWQTV